MVFYSKRTLLSKLEKSEIKISPFDEKFLGPVSYELHLGDSINIIEPELDEFNGLRLKEKKITEVEIPDDGFLLQSKQFVIAKTSESIFCNSETVGIFDGKASLAQIGLFTNISSVLIEPGMDSPITCEIFNSSDHPIRLYKGQKIGQIFFSNVA